MTDCTQTTLSFPPVKRRQVEVNFQGGDITSNGGALLLRQADRYLRLSAAVARALADPRRQASCVHDGLSLLRQRLYGLALGYADLNDHQGLREDMALQTAVEREAVLASRRVASFMVTMTITVICLCMSSVVSSYWSATCGKVGSMAPK